MSKCYHSGSSILTEATKNRDKDRIRGSGWHLMRQHLWAVIYGRVVLPCWICCVLYAHWMLYRPWGEKPKETKQRLQIYISQETPERKGVFALEEFLHVPQNSPNGPLEESRNLGTDCMKSFELHKMLMVALSQASSWQPLRVSNNNSKISIYSLSLSVTQFAAQFLRLYIWLFLLYSCYWH